jgi:hypothetical protein
MFPAPKAATGEGSRTSNRNAAMNKVLSEEFVYAILDKVYLSKECKHKLEIEPKRCSKEGFLKQKVEGVVNSYLKEQRSSCTDHQGTSFKLVDEQSTIKQLRAKSQDSKSTPITCREGIACSPAASFVRR